MYATINLPGSCHFEFYGPASKAECEAWLDRRVAELCETEQITATMPARLVSNKDAESWKYLDGSRVIRRTTRAEEGAFVGADANETQIGKEKK